MAVSDGARLVVYKDLGLVAQVFDEPTLDSLRGHIAIGHTRYSTTGSCTWENAQPTFRATEAGTGLALGHNGNLVNTAELADRAAKDGVSDLSGATTDSDLLTSLLAARPDVSVEAAALEVLPTVRGAFSLVFMDEHTLYAARDEYGVRPLVLGRLERGWVVASETAALDIVGASFVREIEPGELLAIDDDGLRAERFAAPTPKGCLFEYVYLARPDTTIGGRNVQAARVEVGRRLAREHPAEADIVIPVPESGTPAAIGYAQESGIPYGLGLVKNSYVGRTFIQPSQTIRQLGIRLKLNPLRDVLRGRRVVVVDDSIVRGNRLRLARRADRGVRAAAIPAVPGLLRRQIPDSAAGPGVGRQARVGRHRRPGGERGAGRVRRRGAGAGARVRRPGRPDPPVNHRPTRSGDPTGTPAGTVPPTGLTSPIGRTTLTGPAISTGRGDSGDQPGESRAGSPQRRSRPDSATPIGGVGAWGGPRGGFLRGRFAAPRSAAPVTTGVGDPDRWGWRLGRPAGRVPGPALRSAGDHRGRRPRSGGCGPGRPAGRAPASGVPRRRSPPDRATGGRS